MYDVTRLVIASPEAMLFLTVALGVAFGRIKRGGFSFGSAAGTLIVGTVLGALFNASVPDLSPTLKSIAFLFFVFAVGFQSGPHFFASLGRSTLPLAAIAFVVAVTGLIAVGIVIWFFDLDGGAVVGLAAGALTQTAMLGTAYGALEGMALPAGTLQQIQGQAAVTFALTYVIGVIGVILFCSQIGPRLIGVDLKALSRNLDQAQAENNEISGELLDYRALVARVFRVGVAAGSTIVAVNDMLGRSAAIERVRRDGEDLAPADELVLRRGDLLVVLGYRPSLIRAASQIGEEVAAEDMVTDLLGIGQEVVVAQAYVGLTLRQAAQHLGATGRGLFLRRLCRQNQDLPVTADTVLLAGDILEVAGSTERLAQALPLIGARLSRSPRADVAFLAFGLLCGVLIGLLTLTVKGLPITLSAGGGSLLAGLLFGWWQARRPRSNVPQAATQIMWDFGLAAFCALVGLTAGPQAIAALTTGGLTLLAAGAFVTLLPQVVGLLVGRFVLRIDPLLLFGALAGAQTQDAAMLAACDVAESPAPAIGFTVPYAIGNILLTLLGPIIVVMS